MLRTIILRLRWPLLSACAVALLGGASGSASNGQPLTLGVTTNSATLRTTLSAPINDRVLQLTNNDTESGATALGLTVASSHPPLTVNSTARVVNLDADLLDGLDSTRFWKLGGNILGSTAVLGTTTNEPLEFRVNAQRAFRLEPNATSPNVIGGFSGNSVTAGKAGATVAGGGQGGSANSVTGDFGAVGGGAANSAGGSGTVAGGGGNSATSAYSSVAGGVYNSATNSGASVGGGTENTAAGFDSALAGGHQNYAKADDSAVSGGYGNQATGFQSAVAGGSGNTASGTLSFVAGGWDSTAAGNRSLAAGTWAHADYTGSFVWGDSTTAGFSATGNDQFDVRASGGAKIVRGGSSFNAGIGAALQVENDTTAGEAGWFRIGNASDTGRVMSLVKPASGANDFLTCWNESAGSSYSTKCHIDSNGTFVSGSDFAESLPARGGKSRYQAGDVLSINTAKAGQVVESHRPFDRAVIGVYSTRPAVLGADKGGITSVGKQEIPVAITGIVPVKVTAQNGAIRPGDLLTSSSSTGRAMFAGRNPAVGTVLGKALGFLAHGTGMIKMLVMPR